MGLSLFWLYHSHALDATNHRPAQLNIFFDYHPHSPLYHPLTCTQHFTFSLSSFKLRYFFLFFSCFMFTALPIMRWWKFAFNNYLFVYIIISFFHCTIFTILFNCVAFLRLSTMFISRVHFNFFSNNKQRSIFYLLSIFFSFFHRRYISSKLFLCDFQLRKLATSKPFPVSATFHLLLFLCTSLAFTHYYSSTMLHCYPCKSYARL